MYVNCLVTRIYRIDGARKAECRMFQAEMREDRQGGLIGIDLSGIEGMLGRGEQIGLRVEYYMNGKFQHYYSTGKVFQP